MVAVRGRRGGRRAVPSARARGQALGAAGRRRSATGGTGTAERARCGVGRGWQAPGAGNKKTGAAMGRPRLRVRLT